MLEGRSQAPLSVRGRAFAVEAGVAIFGQSSFLFEVGVRGRRVSTSPENIGLTAVRTLALTGGARGRLSVFPIELGLLPIMTGGLEISTTHDLDARTRNRPDARIGIGPHFGIGLEKRLFEGAVVSLLAMGRAEIVPVTLELGLVLELRVN